LTFYGRHFGKITKAVAADECDILNAYETGDLQSWGGSRFVAGLFPRAVPAGQHEMKRAAPSTDSPLQTKIQEQNQTQAPEQRQEQDGQAVIRFIRDPDAAPNFAVKGIDGSTVNLAAARGKVVLLNFWATWCGPCRMEVPDLVELQKKYQDRLQVIGLVIDDADEDSGVDSEQQPVSRIFSNAFRADARFLSAIAATDRIGACRTLIANGVRNCE
jgi:thiol-disulfide isomerase/thioredoxin